MSEELIARLKNYKTDKLKGLLVAAMLPPANINIEDAALNGELVTLLLAELKIRIPQNEYLDFCKFLETVGEK